jgi:hypothetical protein
MGHITISADGNKVRKPSATNVQASKADRDPFHESIHKTTFIPLRLPFSLLGSSGIPRVENFSELNYYK